MREVRNAIILAGGLGLRLRKLVKDIPKPMAPIAGKPFLEYLMLQLVTWGINEVILSIGYRGDVIKSYFGNGDKIGIKIRYAEEKEPLGTAGALKMAAGLLDEEDCIVMNGDSFLDIEFDVLIDFHWVSNAKVSMGLVDVNDASRYGRVVVDNNGSVVGFAEKGTSGAGTINGGVYVVNREIVKSIPSGVVSLEKDVLPLLTRRGLYGRVAAGFFMDIGVPEDYLYLCKYPEKLTCIAGR